MLRVTTLKAAGAQVDRVIDYYAGLAADQLTRDGTTRGPVDYYLDANEPPGRWWGSGRDALNLEGTVLPDQLRALLDARHPGTLQPLGQGYGDKSARGYDATFSAPKPVSVLWAGADPELAAAVAAAHDAAVETALAWLERHGAVTRRGPRGGQVQVDTRGLMVALFRQHTSRTADPQLHTHALVMAKVQDGTGRWLALDARLLKYQQRTIGWIYDEALRVELLARVRRLGRRAEWGPVEGGQADLLCVPKPLCDLFSVRSEQVAAKKAELVRRWVEENNGADPDLRTIADLERQAALKSRPGKTDPVPAEELRAEWAARAAAAGYDLANLLPDSPPLSVVTAWDEETVIATAIARVTEQGATWLFADLAREIATLVPPDCAGNGMELIDLIDALAERAVDRCVDLHPAADPAAARRKDGRPVTEHVTDRHRTTKTVLAEEAGLYAWAEAAAGDVDGWVPLIPNDGLDDTQRDAAAAMAGHAGLVLVVGPAGTGKTTALAAATRSLHAQGRSVLGLAPSGKAADVLQTETGAAAVTLAKLLTAHRHGNPPPRWQLPAGTTVIVDEAGMAATGDLASLAALAVRHRWRVALVGDPDQLPAVGRAGMFADLCEKLPAVHLETVHRFHEEWQAEASLRLRAGDPDAAAVYADHGRVHAVHPDAAADRIARLHQHVTGQGEELAVTTASQSMARAINTEIQWHRHPTGPSVQLADGTSAFVGDRIATRRNDPDLVTDGGVEVRNRHTWTVTHVGSRGSLTVTHPDHGTVRLPARYVADHVQLGWAVTGHGNQGPTYDHSVTIIEPSTTRAGAYVGGTRGRGQNLFVVLDPTGLADPADALAAVIAKPPSALTAHATRRRLHAAHGLVDPDDSGITPDLHAVSGGGRPARSAVFDKLDELQRRHLPPPELGR